MTSNKTYRRRYQVKNEKKTWNGLPWSSLRRGTIVRAIDSGRLYAGPIQLGDTEVVEIKSRLRMFKTRSWLITDRLDDHVIVRPICTHHGEGLKDQSPSILKDSMCIFPFEERDQIGWENEGEPNEVLYLKARLGGYKLSRFASVRASQVMTLDRDEEFAIVAEMDESEVLKVEALERALKLASREGN